MWKLTEFTHAEHAMTSPVETAKKTFLSHISGPSTKDPSIIAAGSKSPRALGKPNNPGNKDEDEPPSDPCHKRCARFIYNKEKKTFCDRTCKSWIAIILYSIFYLIFLSTYTMIFLYGSLCILKETTDYTSMDKTDFQAFTQNGIGLTATPVSVLGSYPLIWYKNGQLQDYKKYTDSIAELLENRFKKGGVNKTDLGPCAEPPYGYGDKPCVIIRINKLINWAAKPLDLQSANAKNAPEEVKTWMKSKKNMLWLHCTGYHSYDKEHIRSFKYYPDPPGFDPDMFPLDMKGQSPMVAVQISDFTLGISLAVECKLWFENGASTVEFMLYVTPQSTHIVRSLGLNSSVSL